MKKSIVASALLTLCAAAVQVQAQQLFQPPVQFLTDQQTQGVAIGDVNGDGRADVVVRAGSGLEVFAQTAAGTLAPSIVYPSNYAEAMRVGDLNGDGRLDAIGLELSLDGHTNTEEAGIWYQNPSGSFDAQVLVPLPHGFSDDAELTDLNNDGRADIVVVNPFNEPPIVILYQQADGTMSAPSTLSIAPGVLSWQVGVGDINHDGRKDIVASYGGYTTDVHLAVFRQNTDGSFAAPELMGAADWLTAVEVADANNDGRQHLLLLHQTSLGVMLQNADGRLAAETLSALPPAGGHPQQGFRAADLNGDAARQGAIRIPGDLQCAHVRGAPRPARRANLRRADVAHRHRALTARDGGCRPHEVRRIRRAGTSRQGFRLRPAARRGSQFIARSGAVHVQRHRIERWRPDVVHRDCEGGRQGPQGRDAADRTTNGKLVQTMSDKLESTIKTEIGVDDGRELPEVAGIDWTLPMNRFD